MKVLSFKDEEISEIFILLAAILHIGNIKYKGVVVQNIDATEINDNVNSLRAATLLGEYCFPLGNPKRIIFI